MSLIDTLGRSSHSLVWLLDISIKLGDEQRTLYLGTQGITLAPSDSIAPSRVYAGRLLSGPNITWSRFSEDRRAGKSSLTVGAVRIDNSDGAYHYIARDSWNPTGFALCRVGELDDDLASYSPLRLRVSSLIPGDDGKSYSVIFESEDSKFDRSIFQSFYWGLNGCLEFGPAAGRLRVSY